VSVAPVSGRHAPCAAEVARQLAHAGLRTRLDAEDSLARRIAVAHHDGVPFVAIIGDREAADGSLTIRAGAGQCTAPVGEAIADLVRRCRPLPDA
jgi:threonyl-tRNA synthetase